MTDPKAYLGIMVSSTFSDLEEHRQALIKSIDKLDFKATVMESSGPQVDNDLIDSSLQMVKDASAYIGIISHKYGQTPACTARNPHELSITELEFNEAVRLERPILLFIMGDDHPIKKGDVETDPLKETKLAVFRERAKKMRPEGEVDRIYETFNSLDEFSNVASLAVGKLALHLYPQNSPVIRDSSHSNNPPNSNSDLTQRYLDKRFKESIASYTSLPSIWTDLEIGVHPETSDGERDEVPRRASEFFSEKQDCIITSLPQFGLTSLAHKVASDAWKQRRELYIVLDAETTPNHATGIKQHIEQQLAPIRETLTSVDAVILDNCKTGAESLSRKIAELRGLLQNKTIVIMETVDDAQSIGSVAQVEGFPRYYLWQLNRSQIREIVRQFIASPAGLDCNLEEDYTTQRIVDDFANLNLHRTALNCVLLLKIAADQIDDSPVNRTEMIERFLFILFNLLSNIPKYSTIPDLKDSLNVLGYFCEHLIRSNEYYFDKRTFFKLVNDYCEEKLISIETDILFACLINENILIRRAGHFTFRYTYWINFFAAHRMLQNKEFCDFILTNRKYTTAPEIIEFYSGIDRRREELVSKLTDDLKKLNDSFEERTGIPRTFDPFEKAEWLVSGTQLEDMQREISETVASSLVPVEVRDRLADKHYDRSKPYDQSVRDFMNDSSIVEAIQVMRAAARALRNSDFVEAETKLLLMSEILRTWTKVVQITVILAPGLAEKRKAKLDGFGLHLSADFDGMEGDELWDSIMENVLPNVIGFYEKDFSSKKMTPLLEHYIKTNDEQLQNHILLAQIIRTRPKDWVRIVNQSLSKLSKKSYYLYRAYREARHEYRLGFSSAAERPNLKSIMGTAIAKHSGARRPNQKQIDKAGNMVVDNIKNILHEE